LGTVDSTTSSSKSIQRYSKEDFVPVGGPIGNGSYGQVRKVVHKRTAELFAMKEIPKKKIKDHKMEDYLHLEIKLQYKLRHPNILRLHYYFENAEMVYLLLEYAGGGSLFSHLRKKGKLPELEAAPVFVGVAKALHYMHNHSVVHRDLKPENILLCAGGVAKVADFGWSAEMKDGAPRHTFCGTWDYLSPEMVQNEPHDHTVDTWAVGVLLYEMITGRAPFAASSQMKALSRITNVDLQIPDYVSALARDLISKILVRARHQRLCLEDAVRHEWARRFVRVDDEVAPPGVNSSPVDRSPVADIDVSATPMVERPVPKPKARSYSARPPKNPKPEDDRGQGGYGFGLDTSTKAGDSSVEEAPRKPLDELRRIISDAGKEGEVVAPAPASGSSAEAILAREEARAMLPPEAAALLKEMRVGKPSASSSQPADAQMKKSAPQASPLDDMHAPEPRELPTNISAHREVPRGVLPPWEVSSAKSSNRPVREVGFDGVGSAPESQPTSYAETDTYKSIRNWVRKNSMHQQSSNLAEELDRTVPVPLDRTLAVPRSGASDAIAGSRAGRRATDSCVASSVAASNFENSRDRFATESRPARDISPIQRSWVASAPSKSQDEARMPLGRDISPIGGREPPGEHRLFLEEGMLDDTYATGAPDPRRLLNGALVDAGLLGAFGTGRDPVDAKA
jgi:serine/threonine protein kinase